MPGSDLLASAELTSILQQLEIKSVAEISTFTAKFIAERFTEEQLKLLNNSLRTYLSQANLLRAKVKILSQYNLSVEILGLAPHIQTNLINNDVQTVTEFIKRDHTHQLTHQWPIRDRLAIRTRIYCLLTLSPEQLNKLKLANVSNLTVTPANGVQTLEPPEEQCEIRHSFRLTAPDTPYNTASPNSDEFEDYSFLHPPWLNEWLPDDFSPTYPEIVNILFEDVYQLPIATSRRHEIWAGAQMKAAERLRGAFTRLK